MFRHMLPLPLSTRATHRITSQGVSFFLVNVCVPCLKALLATWSVCVYIYSCLHSSEELLSSWLAGPVTSS